MRPEKGSFQISSFVWVFGGLLQSRRAKRLIFTNFRNSRERNSFLFQAWFFQLRNVVGMGHHSPIPYWDSWFFFGRPRLFVFLVLSFFSRTPFARFPFKDFLICQFRTRLLKSAILLRTFFPHQGIDGMGASIHVIEMRAKWMASRQWLLVVLELFPNLVFLVGESKHSSNTSAIISYMLYNFSAPFVFSN